MGEAAWETNDLLADMSQMLNAQGPSIVADQRYKFLVSPRNTRIISKAHR